MNIACFRPSFKLSFVITDFAVGNCSCFFLITLPDHSPRKSAPYSGGGYVIKRRMCKSFLAFLLDAP